MDIFYIIVLGIAVVLLIIVLAFVGVGMRKHGYGGAWPPIESTCPDYWQVDPSDSNYCLIPPAGSRNVGTIFSGNSISATFAQSPGYDPLNKRINFNHPELTLACQKKLWAKKWGIYWDGYTNYNGCPAPGSS